MKNTVETAKNNKPGQFLNRSPFQDLLSLQNKMDHWFQDLWNTGNTLGSINKNVLAASMYETGFVPSCDIDESDVLYLLSFDIPGVKKEDIRVSVQENQITISGERKSEEEANKKSNRLVERTWSSFSRSIRLPLAINTEKIEAQYADGVLRVAAPKAEITQVHQVKVVDAQAGFLEKLKSGEYEKH